MWNLFFRFDLEYLYIFLQLFVQLKKGDSGKKYWHNLRIQLIINHIGLMHSRFVVCVCGGGFSTKCWFVVAAVTFMTTAFIYLHISIIEFSALKNLNMLLLRSIEERRYGKFSQN